MQHDLELLRFYQHYVILGTDVFGKWLQKLKVKVVKFQAFSFKENQKGLHVQKKFDIFF